MSSDDTPHGMRFVPEYADCIAHATNNWAHLEYCVNACIWLLAEVAPGLGACMTSQIYTLNGRLNALVALMRIRRCDPKLIKRVNVFSADVRDAQDARNRIVHDLWLGKMDEPKVMAKLRITADKTLRFSVDDVPLAALKADLDKIILRRKQFDSIRSEIIAAYDALPGIPLKELRPITENLDPRQNPSSETK